MKKVFLILTIGFFISGNSFALSPEYEKEIYNNCYQDSKLSLGAKRAKQYCTCTTTMLDNKYSDEDILSIGQKSEAEQIQAFAFASNHCNKNAKAKVLSSNNNNIDSSYEVFLKCNVVQTGVYFKLLIDEIDIFGDAGDVRFFHIIKEDPLQWEVKSKWNPYEKNFEKKHIGEKITKKYITFYSQIQFEEESKGFTNKMRINRETGEMEHFKGTPYEKDKYEAYCDKISFNDLPLELVKQKF